MKLLSLKNPEKIFKNKRVLENKLKVKLEFDKKNKNNIKIIGKEVNIFDAEQVLLAMDFGFNAETALLLKNGNYLFEILYLKDYTRRKNLKEVRARIIGKKGKAINTLKNLTGSEIMLKENSLGIISLAENIEKITTALSNLIKGSKHSNVYSYLEKKNRDKKIRETDLGLKEER